MHFWDPEPSWINVTKSIYGIKMVACLGIVQTNRGLSDSPIAAHMNSIGTSEEKGGTDNHRFIPTIGFI